MKPLNLTNEQARNFILLKQGLMGDYKFSGKQGVCDFILQTGCIQFDPIDVCGKNAELNLQSRVRGFTKEMLYELLYVDRKLVDYFDKNLAILSVEDWKYFARTRQYHRENGRCRDKVNSLMEQVKGIIREKGYASSKDIGFNEKVDWYWSPTTLSRSVLETLYFRGDLIIHHKEGTIKHYALAEEYFSPEILEAEDPNQTDFDFMKWQVLRRIGAIGLLWNKPSDAWLGIDGLKADCRNIVFSDLVREKKILECHVEGIPNPLYYRMEDESLIQAVQTTKDFKKRMEFIAPLDNFMWDRKLIQSLFGFGYKWEIYTPIDQRKYGYYVLPVLYGNRFIGRLEAVTEKKKLVVKNFWGEQGMKWNRALQKSFEQRLLKFAQFNDCEQVIMEWNRSTG